MGEAPLPYTEIEAYGRASGGLNAWECRALRRMSEAYIVAKNDGRDDLAIPPWDGDD